MVDLHLLREELELIFSYTKRFQFFGMVVQFHYLRVRNKRRSPKYDHTNHHVSRSKLLSECTKKGVSVKNMTIR